MAATKLTDLQIGKLRAVPGERLRKRDGLVPGLEIRVTDRGVKTWRLLYRFNGKQYQMKLGRWDAVKVANARTLAKAELLKVAQGINPADEKRAERRAETFEAVATEFVAKYAKVHHRRWQETEQAIKAKLLPRWGQRPVGSIIRRDVLDLLDAEMDAGRQCTANKVLALVRKIFNWATERGIVETSPVAGVRAPGKELSRDRVLDDDELAAVWNAAGEMGWPWASFVRLLIATAQRRDEVREMRWSEIDLERRLWTIPRERTKLDRAHDVPLSDLAVEILEGLPRIAGGSDLVFPANRIGSRNSISGLSKMKRRLDAGIAEQRAEQRLGRPLAKNEQPKDEDHLQPWRVHDLRRTAASVMAMLGHPPHVVSAILNHAPSASMGITAIYVRHRFTDERRVALDAWARHLERITTGSTGQVVALPARR